MKFFSLVVAILIVTGCNNPKPEQWCEQDATDTVVDDSLCMNNTPGYEWEPDGDDYYDSSNHKTYPTYKPPAPTYKVNNPVYKPPAPPVKTK